MSDNFSGRAPLVAVTGSLPLGGSSTFLVNLARAFRQRDLLLPIIVLDPENAYAADFRAIGNPVHCLPHRRFIYEDRVRWSYERAAHYAPGAVLSCLSSESFEILRLAPKGVLRMSIVQSDDPGPYGTVAAFGAWTDVVVGVSNQIAEKLRAMPALSRARVEAIPYGIDFPPKLPREKRGASEPLRVIYLGRLIEEQKRISRIGELARMLESQNANVEFTVAGEGPQRASLEAALRGCRRVRLREAVPYDQVNALLSQQDVFVLLSDFEGLPLSLLEAMGCGVVPVVSDLPSGMAEVVNDSRGVRVPVGDVSAAARAITDLSHDRMKLDRCSEKCAEFVRTHYSAEVMASRYLRLIPEGKTSEWPRPKVAVPLGVEPQWMFKGFPRLCRRWAKRFIA